MKTPIIVFILLVSVRHIYAQNKNYFFKHLDTRDGVSGEEVIGFAQDNKGFIWMTTSNGLQRYDGEKFITYRHLASDTNSISADETFLPQVDKQNNLWLLDPEACVNEFNMNTSVAIKLSPIRLLKEKVTDHFVSFCQDAKGNIWLSGSGELYCYHPVNKQLEKIAFFPDSLVNHNFQGMACDTLTGNIWISSRYRLIEYNRKENAFFDFHHNPGREPVFNLHSEPSRIFVDSRRNLWFSTWQGELFRYNMGTHFLKQYYFKGAGGTNTGNRVGGIVEDKSGNIWVGANSSDIYFYNPVRDGLELSATHFIEKPSTSQTDINSLFCDRENNIWIATRFGAYYFNPAKQKIFTVSGNSFDHFSLPASQVETIGESSDGLIWVSSRNSGGVTVYDKQMNIIRRLFYPGDSAATSFPRNLVTAFCTDSNGKFWMSAFKTLFQYDPQSKQIKRWAIPEMNFFVHAMICDADNTIWIGGDQSIIRLNPLNQARKLIMDFSPDYAAEPAEIRDMFLDQQQNIWVATLGQGIFRFDKQSGKFDFRVRHSESNDRSLCNDDCLCFGKYDKNSMLVGTAKGLSLVKLTSKESSNLHNAEGILSDIIRGIGADRFGNIFLSTTNGLYKIDGKTKRFTHYTMEDGILDNQFYSKICVLSDGRMLIGGLNGFIYFNPIDLHESFIPPDVQVSEYKIFDKIYPLDSTGDIKLPYDQNFITIRYSSLYFNSPAKINYYYKLDAVDKNWVDAGEKRNAVYTDLDDGNYDFEVKCVNDNGVPSTHITSIHVMISPPWWRTWWIYCLYAAFLVGTVYSFFSYRINRLRTRQREQLLTMVSTQEEERKRISRDLHDDVGTKLSALKLFLASLKNNIHKRQYDAVDNLSAQAESLINETMKDVRSMLLNLSPAILEEFGYSTAVEALVDKINEAKLTSFNLVLFGLQKGLPQDYELALYRITQELINNVLKHAAAKMVYLQVGYREQHIVVTIEDDGRGFDLAAVRMNGYGLKNLEGRCRLLGGRMDIDTEPGKGTRVLIELPFQY